MNESTLDLWNIPAGAPPAVEVSNFINPPNQGPLLAIGIYILFPLMTPFVVARIFTRAYVTRTFGKDDFLCIIAVVCIFAYSGVLLTLLNIKPFSPFGRHVWNDPVAALSNEYCELTIMAGVTCPAALMCVKLSILAFNYRIFQTEAGARRAIWLGVTMVSVFYMVTIIIALAVCVPKHGETWLLKISTSGACPKVQVRIARAQGIFGLISDLYIFAIPLWIVSQLSLPPKRKAGVILVFLIGFLAIASSAGGLATREQVTLADPYRTTPYLFGLCEASFGLICSCMPALTALLRVLTTKLASYWTSIGRYSHTLFSPTHHSSPTKEQLPGIPRGTLSGLKTFIRRFHRTNGQSVLVSDASTSTQLGAVQDYHEQLRNIHTRDIERLAPVYSNKLS